MEVVSPIPTGENGDGERTVDEVVLYVDGGPRRKTVGSVLIIVGVVDGSSLSISTSRNGREELLSHAPMGLRDVLCASRRGEGRGVKRDEGRERGNTER